MATKIKQIFDELNKENGSKYKISILEKHKNNELFKRVLVSALDNIKFTYGVTFQNIMKFQQTEEMYRLDLESAINLIQENVATRVVTGNAALQMCSNIFNSLSDDDADVLKRIIDRDLKCNVGTSLVNKVLPNLITKQIYMRCGVFCDKTKNKINFPAIIQLKADGTYREFTVKDGEVKAKSRSGESYEYPIHFEKMKDFPDGVYTGELTVNGVQDRKIGNGMINSLEPPHEKIIFDVWDFITLDDYILAGELKQTKDSLLRKIKKIKTLFDSGTISRESFKKMTKFQKQDNAETLQQKTPKVPYIERFNKLKSIIKEDENIKIIPHKMVQNVNEALKQTSEWMTSGFEGGVLKNTNGIFKDGTSTDQLKLKLCIDAEMRVVGFADGKVGSKREGKVGAIIFQNDDETVKGRTSGFSDAELDEMVKSPQKYLNKIITVQFNDLTKAENHDFYALSHPRFIELRTDKTETDSLEKLLELREMAINLK